MPLKQPKNLQTNSRPILRLASERAGNATWRVMQPAAPSTQAPLTKAALTTLLALIILMGLIELTLQAADWGLVGSPRWRGLAYQNGGFWAGLLYNWRPNYAAQPALMFASYGLLHAGLTHMATNMIALLFLGRIVIERMGLAGFTASYALSSLTGAAAFGLLTTTSQPMVGASGALFGLVGAWQADEAVLRFRAGRSLWPIWRAALWFALLNLVMWAALAGQLAWETHLGGFLGGAAVSLIWHMMRKRQPTE